MVSRQSKEVWVPAPAEGAPGEEGWWKGWKLGSLFMETKAVSTRRSSSQNAFHVGHYSRCGVLTHQASDLP